MRVGHDAAPHALRADDGRRSRLGAGARADGAHRLGLDGDAHLDALQRVLERDAHVRLEVVAAQRLPPARTAGSPAAAEHPPEEVAQVPEVELLKADVAGAARESAWAARAERVVLLPLLGV